MYILVLAGAVIALVGIILIFRQRDSLSSAIVLVAGLFIVAFPYTPLYRNNGASDLTLTLLVSLGAVVVGATAYGLFQAGDDHVFTFNLEIATFTIPLRVLLLPLLAGSALILFPYSQFFAPGESYVRFTSPQEGQTFRTMERFTISGSVEGMPTDSTLWIFIGDSTASRLYFTSSSPTVTQNGQFSLTREFRNPDDQKAIHAVVADIQCRAALTAVVNQGFPPDEDLLLGALPEKCKITESLPFAVTK